MSLQALDSNDAIARISAGLEIRGCDLAEVDLSGLTLPGLQIINCSIGTFLANGAVFEGPVDFVGSTVGVSPSNVKRADGPETSSLPSTAAASFRNVVFRSPVRFTATTFHEFADFSATTFNNGADFCDATFEEKAEFLNAFFAGRIRFEKTRFAGQVDFSDSDFDEEASFRGARFEGDADFAEAEFVSAEFQDALFGAAADFRATLFGGWADFSRVAFHAALDISHARFDSGADFCEARFLANTKMESAIFGKDCNFAEARFSQDVNLDRVVWKQHADFRSCQFEGTFSCRGSTLDRGFFGRGVFQHWADLSEFNANELDFRETTFRTGLAMTRADLGNTTFEEAQVLGPADFTGSVFSAMANFQKAHLSDACFKSVQFSGPVTFQESTIAGKGDFNQAKFLGTTCFLNFSTADLLLSWEQVRGSLRSEATRNYDEARMEYGFLKNHFERHNEYDDMDNAHRMFKRCERKSKPFARGRPYRYFSKPLNALLLDLGSGYGTKPMNVGVLTLVTIVLFATVYAMFSQQIMLGGETAAGLQDFGFHLYYSFVVFISVGAENLHPDYLGWLKYVVAAEGFSGFFLMTLFVVTFTRKVIR